MTSSTARWRQALCIPTAEVFNPFLQNPDARYWGARGGRGGAKSQFFAGKLLEDSWAEPGLLSVCLREVQKTLRGSSKQLLENKLSEAGLGEADGFKIFREVIETPGDGLITFEGMQAFNAESIKSLEGRRRVFWDEAEGASPFSLKILRPTIRAAGAQLWFSWNPKNRPDPENPMASVDGMFALRKGEQLAEKAWECQLPGGGVLVECGYPDNPWFPESLEEERLDDLRIRTTGDYRHIWEGEYEVMTEARVFQNWRQMDFRTPAGIIPRFGGDFGFARDPAVAIRCFLGRWEGEPGGKFSTVRPDENGRDLFIDHEAWRIGCEVDFHPALFAGNCPFPEDDPRHWENPYNDPGIPEAMRYQFVADSARPETISYCQRHGFPFMEGALKGPGSIAEGIEFLKSFRVWVHPSCKHTLKELSLYSHKVDPRTERVLPDLVDKNNHLIDSLRYAIEPLRRPRGFFS